MKRAIVTRVDPSPSAVAELKQWLAISTGQDDAALTGLLRTSLEACEAFTGIMPVATLCQETLAFRRGWQTLATRPVQAISAAEAISSTGVRTTLAPTDYAVELEADGCGRVSITAAGDAQTCIVSFTAGLAHDWDSLPDTLRHGIMRLSAHQYRERDGSGAGPLPPASVAALWRPWRRVRIA